MTGTLDKILIVDDNPMYAGALADILRPSDFTIFQAENGQSALNMLSEVHPDLILLDVMMPLMDGLETCLRIKALPEFEDIPIIFMTATSDANSKVRGFEVGAVDYISKPALPREVLVRVNTHLAFRRMRVRLEEQNAQLAHEIAERERVEDAMLTSEERYRELSQAVGQSQSTVPLNMIKEASETRASRGSILVVDDTATNQLLLAQMLEVEGYEVATASSGQAALDLVTTNPPDVILLDINMPVMNGYEVCEQLKANPATSEIPVLFISALSSTEDKVKAFTAGGVDYIVKPFQPEEVLARVETHLTLRDLQRQLRRYAQHLQQMVMEKVRELERERSKIVQMDKMAALGQMATGVAHELNQPLTAISFEADYLKAVAHKAITEQIPYDILLDVDQLEEMGENLRGDVARCRRIIDHLRIFGRISTEERGLINVNQPIEDCFILIGARLENHNVNVHLNLDPELPFILADTHRLEQVFLNLIGNAEYAVEAMETRVQAGLVAASSYQKTLEISTRVVGNAVVAEVRDNGCGIPEDTQKHIFEPFFTTKPVGEGTGLGLSISYGIVTELGGEITFVSAEDAGTTFTLRFPIADVQVGS